MFENFGQLANLMKNASKIRESMEKAAESMASLRVEGSAAGGAVQVVATGQLELVSVRIDPKLVADGDVELLEDLLLAAVNQALQNAREAAGQSLQGIAGDFLPPGSNPTGGNPLGFGFGPFGKP
jgi:DNA-binding YbaB/EbfC family protein